MNDTSLNPVRRAASICEAIPAIEHLLQTASAKAYLLAVGGVCRCVGRAGINSGSPASAIGRGPGIQPAKCHEDPINRLFSQCGYSPRLSNSCAVEYRCEACVRYPGPPIWNCLKMSDDHGSIAFNGDSMPFADAYSGTRKFAKLCSETFRRKLRIASRPDKFGDECMVGVGGLDCPCRQTIQRLQ